MENPFVGSTINYAFIIILTAAAFTMIIAVMAQVMRRYRPQRLPIVAKPLMTKAELEFYRRLNMVARKIGNIHVLAQVAMGAIMQPEKGLDPKNHAIIRNRFNKKIIDFVLVDESARILLLIELDDPSHDSEKDRLRDEMTINAGYKTMRIKWPAAKNNQEIERLIRIHLN